MDLKQLKYFIACVETGSFSEAAGILYTTQSSVSKTVKMLEDSLGLQLFERLPRGIRLTAQGRRVYHYACRIVNEASQLERMAGHGATKWLRIASNPSSWFADQFVDFYIRNYEKNYHFQITTAGVRTVMERVRDYLDDIGFVYILDDKKEDFLHELSGYQLGFEELHRSDIIFYPGAENCFFKSDKKSIRLKEMEGIRFIQNYQDEYFDIETLAEEGVSGWNGLDVSVLTNSNYIMEKMLKRSNAANISGSYLSSDKEGTSRGIPIEMKENQVIFGYIFHKAEEIDESILEFIEFLKEQIR